MDKPLALVDVDQVCLDLLPAWLELYNKKYNDSLQPSQIVRWEIDELVVPACRVDIYHFLQTKEIYDLVHPVAGALEGVEFLRQFYRVIFTTASRNPWQRIALSRLGFFDNGSYHNDHFVGNDKSVYKGELMIDDRHTNFVGFTGFGILFDVVHNRDIELPYGIVRGYGWEDIMVMVQHANVKYC
jgi:5'(3')-deoxyribonucleotidase